MPGPKMGARPADFDENIVRRAPTFIRWLKMEDGEKLRYACREFVKGHGDDEERLMRRIMIARRNNLRDHEVLKRARQTTRAPETPSHNTDNNIEITEATAVAAVVPDKKEIKQPISKKRRTICGITDAQVAAEMDVLAVEATRSYIKWEKLEPGKEFIYNQKYIKGKDGHDWLLRKNIWRRMRYRRENKKMVDQLKIGTTETTMTTVTTTAALPPTLSTTNNSGMTAADVVDQALLAGADGKTVTVGSTMELNDDGGVQIQQEGHEFVHKAVVEAAVAAAETYVNEQTTAAVAAAAAAAAAATTVADDGTGATVGGSSVDQDAANLTSSIAAMSVPPTAVTDLRVHNPLEAAASSEALDAAAKLAAAAAPQPHHQPEQDNETILTDSMVVV